VGGKRGGEAIKKPASAFNKCSNATPHTPISQRINSQKMRKIRGKGLMFPNGFYGVPEAVGIAEVR